MKDQTVLLYYQSTGILPMPSIGGWGIMYGNYSKRQRIASARARSFKFGLVVTKVRGKAI